MVEGVLRIDHPPAHGGGAGAVFLDEFCGMGAGFGVHDVGDVALLPELDILAPVPADQFVAHLREERAQLFRIGVGEFDKFETVGAGRVFGRDDGFRGVVRERSHGVLLLAAGLTEAYAHDCRKFAHSAGSVARTVRFFYGSHAISCEISAHA